MRICRFFYSQWFIFLLFVIVCGTKQMIFPYDNAWDLVNYHYYNAWAFSNDRLGYDIAPATLHTYFNPLMDLPFYWMIQYWNDYPHLIAFMQGAWSGLLLFVFYKIVLLFFDVTSEKIKILLTIMIAATGFSFLSQVGTTTNEIQVSFLILCGFYLIARNIERTERSLKIWVISGALMGAALGFKPTVVTYCCAMGLILILFAKQLGVSSKEIIFFALFGLIGYLSVNGYFMVRLYNLFGNPFFPFLNKIFHSPYFIDDNFRDARYTDISWIKKIFLPFYFSSYTKRYVSEVWFHDFRFAIAYVVLIVSLIKWGYQSKFRFVTKRLDLLFYAFIFSSYLIWLNVFSIIRYAIILEMFSALVLVRFFTSIRIKNTIGYTVFGTLEIIGLFVLISAVPEYIRVWQEVSGKQKYIEMEKIHLPDNALIKLYGFPSAMPAALAIGDRHDIKLVGYANRSYRIPEDFMEVTAFRHLRNEAEQNHQGAEIALVSSLWGNADERLKQLRYTGMYCRLLQFRLWQINICVPKTLKSEILGE
ncbi:MAG: hypothetical protein IJ545_08195 [Alphaproteobacteria bacterium]|nr:hypothetical protein [Alphaproteobacteria bacterium]